MNTKFARTAWPATLFALFCAGLVGGCTPLDLHMRLPWQDKDETPAPQKVVSFWSDTVMYQQGMSGIRGFGGRVFFYDKKDTKPIPVDGSLTVYAFDADHFDPTAQRPEKKFVFTPEQLSQHFSQSELGPSYSIWLPWDEVMGPTRNLSLVTRFEGRNGGVVIGEPTNKLLPGTNSKDEMKIEYSRQSRGADASLAAYHQEAPSSDGEVATPTPPAPAQGIVVADSIDLAAQLREAAAADRAR